MSIRHPVFALGALLIALASSSCASSALGRAQVAEQHENYDQAIVEYNRILSEDPDNVDTRLALDRARLRSSQEHFFSGRRLAEDGRLEEALVEFQIASELNPSSGAIVEALDTVRGQLRARIVVDRGGRTELEALIERTRNMPAPGQELPADLVVPAAVTFRDASSRDVFSALARFADVSVAFDPTFREEPISVDFRDATFAGALEALTATTRTFYRVTAPRTLTIIPDTPAKRLEYEEEIVRTFYLSNADLTEAIDMLRIVIDSRRIAPISATNAITIKDTPERVAAASRILTAVDKARPEVIIEVELLEVNRSRLREYGLQIASPGSPGIDGSIDVNQPNLTLDRLLNLSQADVFIASLPGLYYRLLKSDTNTRQLANPQLRTAEGVAAQAQFGEEVPVPVTVFAPIAAGGVNQQPITSFEYRPIGVNIDITPRTHHNNEVTLEVQVEISSITGTGFGSLPTFGNRRIDTVIRLKDGETNMLAGLIREEERDTVDGIPGLSDIPMVGRMFAHTKTESQQTDIILTLTPHIVRVLDLSEEDLRPFSVGRDAQSITSSLPTPAINIVPPRDRPAVEQAQPFPGTVTPIRPPTPAGVIDESEQ
jgi:general secretion pathway protein D